MKPTPDRGHVDGATDQSPDELERPQPRRLEFSGCSRARVVENVHARETYRLLLTRNNLLISQK